MNKEQTEKLYLERCKLFRDAIAFKKPARVPYYANIWTWRWTDAGYTVSEVCNDYEKVKIAMDLFFSKYNVDAVVDSGVRNPFPLVNTLGHSWYDNLGNEKFNCGDKFCFDVEDYDAMKENFVKALWEIGQFKKFPDAKNYTPEQYAKAAKSLQELYEVRDWLVKDLARGKYGCFTGWTPNVVGFELMYNFFRGIKGVSLDLRRNPQKLKEVCLAIDEVVLDPVIQQLRSLPKGYNMERPYDEFSLMLAHTVLSEKQFGDIYWPAFKKYIDTFAETGKQLFVFSEGNWIRFADFFDEVPKGVVALQVELDDIYEVRKRNKTITLCGGLQNSVMGNGTPQECVEMAKRAIDTLGKDGGFILSENKMCSYPADAKPENVKAVAEFASQYWL